MGSNISKQFCVKLVLAAEKQLKSCCCCGSPTSDGKPRSAGRSQPAPARNRRGVSPEAYGFAASPPFGSDEGVAPHRSRRAVSPEAYGYAAPPPFGSDEGLPPSASGITGLQVDKIDGKIKENKVAHKTDKYETDALIVRRGQPFVLTLGLKQPYVPSSDAFQLVMTTGKQKIQVELVNGEFKKDKWGFKIVKADTNQLTLSVYCPATTVVSRYTLSVVATHKDETGHVTQPVKEYEKRVYVLFNAWNPDDEVYMAEEDLKKEYVLNDTGHIYWGGKKPKPWFYGQFTDPVVQCVFKILDGIDVALRSDVRQVSRLVSAWSNVQDEDGILIGNWSDDYSGGVKPWEWIGSANILKQYFETGEPVGYGQCWVFAGVVATVMRCLGVPCRTVTNYDSAHDSDANCTYDKYYDVDGTYMSHLSRDSSWNFHVWNDAWMSRPDLPEGFGGWQCIDGTPQEESDGVYQCGPASVQAVKEGYVLYNFDTKFVFAEVSADLVYWQKQKDTGKFKAIRVDTDVSGHYMSTKMPNDIKGRLDVTQDYKFEAGTVMERAAEKHALGLVNNPVLDPNRPKDVSFTSELEWNVTCGSGIDFKVIAENTSGAERTVKTVVNAHLIQYNGMPLATLEQQTGEKKMDAKGRAELDFRFPPTLYEKFVDVHPILRISLFCEVKETGQVYVKQKVARIDKPDLELELVGKPEAKVKAGQRVDVQITIPFPICNFTKYTSCSLHIVGSAIEGEMEEKIPDVVDKKSAVLQKQITISKTAKAGESLQLIASFNSAELSGITETLEVFVVA